MFHDYHFMGWHWLWWIVIIGLILIVVYNIIPFKPRESALDILKRRHAEGEIEREEYEERRKVLQDQ